MKRLTKPKLEHFRKLFLERRADIAARVQNNSGQELDTDGDEIDAVQAAQIHELASKLSGHNLQMIRNIDAALERIDSKTFGLCESCDEQIGEKRLEAMPLCSFCIDCQEQMEMAEKQFK